MSIESHLAELERKHQSLERQIEEELQRAAGSDLRVAELKRRKLFIKDEINRIRADGETLH